jgi:CheY-like chemotaxis protein/anti-sigma regulatory factor (Ser/Thr protein kinase)
MTPPEPTTSPIDGRRASSTVLIVDDYAIDRRIAGSIVEKFAGLRPTYATDGEDALASIAREEPAVVLTDIQMPGMDGLALVQAIREKYPRLPVILMTANGSEDVAIHALRAGATNYVPKKSLARELAETLRQVLDVAGVDRRRQKLLGSLERRESAFRLENDPELITSLIQMLQEDLGMMGLCDDTTRMRIGVALQEAMANALYHGNLEVSSDLRQDDEREFYSLAERRRSEPPYRNRHILVNARLEREGATWTIEDEGPGFDTSKLDKPIDPEDLMRIGGRGMLLIRTFMDEVSHNPTGNRITLVKRAKIQ